MELFLLVIRVIFEVVSQMSVGILQYFVTVLPALKPLMDVADIISPMGVLAILTGTPIVLWKVVKWLLRLAY